MIRVILVDDQTLVRQGIRSLLELTKDIQVVAEASDGDEALATIARIEADVVLLDVRMPRRTGLEVLDALQRSAPPGRPTPPCILLTTFDDDSVAVQGIRLGARGFLLKDVTLEQLTEAIRTVASGGTLRFESSPLPSKLTPRETEVLRLLATGASNKEIADALGTAEGTVKNQVSSVMQKLGVRDRTRAVLKALELGVV